MWEVFTLCDRKHGCVEQDLGEKKLADIYPCAYADLKTVLQRVALAEELQQLSL